MAHNIYNDGTKDCMFAVGKREDVWHMLGQRCDSAVNWEQAVELAGLNWQVLKQQNYARNPLGKVVPVDSFTIFRDSDMAELGTVGADYTIKQNRDCFRFVDDLLEANGGSHYDTAGALGNGARIWCAVRVPSGDIEPVPGDKFHTYLVFMTSHDGSMSHTVLLVKVRVVCANTFQEALRSADSIFRFKHTKNADARMADAKRLMTGMTQDAKTLEEKLRLLSQRKVTRESLDSIMTRLFPLPKEANANTTRRENIIAEILSLYESNDNNAIPVIRGSAYNLLNAVTEYTDHFRNARITENRAGMSLMTARAENAVAGTGDKLKQAALEVILQSTENAPVMNPSKLIYAPSPSDPSVNGLLGDVLANHEQ